MGSVFQWRGVSFGALGSSGKVRGAFTATKAGMVVQVGFQGKIPSGNCADALPGSGELFVVQAWEY